MTGTLIETPADGAVWDRLIEPTRAELPPEAARYFLSLQFNPADRQQMHELAARHQADELSPTEQATLASYRRVAIQLDLLWAKARASLHHLENGQAS